MAIYLCQLSRSWSVRQGLIEVLGPHDCVLDSFGARGSNYIQGV